VAPPPQRPCLLPDRELTSIRISCRIGYESDRPLMSFVRLLSSLALMALLTFVQSAMPAPPQDAASAVIEGGVFDRNDAVIQNVAISILDLRSHTVTSVRTDDRGRYSLSVKPGRYSLTQEPIVGWLIPNEHSSFFVSAGERVVINFRPRWVFTIVDSIEGGHWIEKYETDDSM